MRRPLPLVLLLAVTVAAALWATSSGSGPGASDGAGAERPTSFSAAVASSSAAAAASTNWANRSAAASADPSRWGEPRGRETARRSRARMTRRLVALVLASTAERLAITPAELRAAVRTVAREHRPAGRPTGAELDALRLRLASALGRELGRPRVEILQAARAELAGRLQQGVDLGFVTAGGRELALDCFDAPSACDLGALRRALRFGRLLGR
jgi:hypothetical protein